MVQGRGEGRTQPLYRHWPVAAVCVSGERLLMELKVYAHMKSGQDGTRRLVEQYGEKLPCAVPVR